MKSIKTRIKFISIILLFTVYFSFGFPTMNVVMTYQAKDKFLQLGAVNAQAASSLPKTELEKLSAGISETFGEMDENLEKKNIKMIQAAVKDTKQLIKSSEADIKKEFSKQKGKAKKYPKAIERLEGYQAEFNKKLEGVKRELTELESMLGSKNLKDSEFKKVKEKLGELHQQLSPEAPHFPTGNTLPNRDMELKAHELATENEVTPAYLGSEESQNLVQTPEDLAETAETKATDDIKKLADSLDGSALSLYDYVRNKVKFEPYLGSRKGATGTLQQLAGNDVDQASLLISLLRYKGIPARYVTGTVEIPIEQVKNWVGVTNPQQAVRTLGALGIPLKAVHGQGKIVAVQMEHTWVEAKVPYEDYRGAGAQKGETAWVPLDPSFKQNVYKEGLKFEELTGLNKEVLLDAAQNSGDQSGDEETVTNLDMNAIQGHLSGAMSKLEAYIHEQGLENAQLNDVIGSWEVKEQKLGILPLTLPYKTVAITKELTSLPNEMNEWVSFSIRGGSPFGFNFSGEDAFKHKAKAVDLYGKRITLSWAPATEEDANIISEYGGIFKTPTYMVEVTPLLKVDGNTVAEGKPVGLAYTQEFVMGFSAPGMGEEEVKNPVTAGAFYAVGLDFGKIASGELDQIKVNVEALKNKVNPDTMYTDEALGEILNGVVKSYFGQLDVARQLISQQYDVSANRLLSGAMTGYQLNVGYMFMAPAKIAPGGMYIDVDRNIASVVSKKGKKQDELSFMLATGSLESAMEHGIYEQFLGLPSVSTIKVLEEANKRGIPIYTVTKQNISKVLPKLKISSTVKNDITNSVNKGRIVTIPEEEIQYYDWHGTGYIAMDPKSGAAGYMISGGTAGGSTSLPVDIASLIALIDGFIALISAISLLASGTIIGVFLGLVLVILAIAFLVQLFDLMYQYYVLGDTSVGGAIITQAIISIVAALGGSLLVKFFPGIKSTIDDIYNAIATRLANRAAADRLANQFSKDFVNEVVKKSGTDSLPKVENLVKQLTDSGVSKDIIERIGKNEGAEGLENLQKLIDLGLSPSQISKILDNGINLADAIRLAEKNILPDDYAKYGIRNGTDVRELFESLTERNLTLGDLSRLVDSGLSPSIISKYDIRSSGEITKTIDDWNKFKDVNLKSLNTGDATRLIRSLETVGMKTEALIKYGFDSMAPHIVKSFKNFDLEIVESTGEELFRRGYPGEPDRALGKFWGDKYRTIEEARNDLAILEEWGNPLTGEFRISVPNGQKMLKGPAAEQYGTGEYRPGGGIQYWLNEVPNSWLIK
ncbi:transglutaminase domain-containing protein [Bacillus sp. EB01]|uniref:transglutaminase domain-containing protein n=1 Tax=Bacillus sp. EB01 TaxID=1347086 RepID=UPI000694FF67|nr:transglutaminase domain-containing protein [Bacillus sp. EB01]